MSNKIGNLKSGPPKFESAVFFVSDVERSKNFYVNILDQKIIMDFGRNVGFEGGFSIWEADYALNTIFAENAKDHKIGKNNSEIYFEIENLDEFFDKLKKKSVEVIHNIREHPWGQRAFRFYDPDNHIIEIGEPMHNVVIRMYKEGMSIEEIKKKSLMPIEFIKQIVDNIQK